MSSGFRWTMLGIALAIIAVAVLWLIGVVAGTSMLAIAWLVL